MNIKRMVVMLVGSAVIFGGVLGFARFRDAMIAKYFSDMPRPVVAVTAQPAKAEDWTRTLSAVGTLSAANGVDVSSAASGLVREILFQSGQAVKKGQVLLRLDADVELGDLHSAMADSDLARITATRQRTLVRTNAVAQAAVDKAEAELKAKEARVAGIRAQIERKVVVAPFDGVLGVRKVDLGQFLQSGQPIVNLQDLSVLRAEFSVSQKDLAALAPGQVLHLTADAWPGRVFDGTVAAIEPQVDAKTGMVLVEGRFPNPDGALRPGMFAKIEVVQAGSRRVVTIPDSAVAYSLHGDSVFMVRGDKDGKTAERAAIDLGERRDGRVVVLKGIAPGEMVVTSGQLKLENGTRLTISADDPLQAAEDRPPARE